jgi:hypothetical protein
MKFLIPVACLFIFFTVLPVLAVSVPQSDVGNKILQKESEQNVLIEAIKGKQRDVAGLLQGTIGRYGREFLDKAKLSLQRAQQAAESGKITSAQRITELAAIQIQRATTVASERESAEKTTIKRSELKKLEERIDVLLKGKVQ